MAEDNKVATERFVNERTYTKSEVDAIVAALKTGSRVVVESLPETGVAMTIYMVAKSTAQTNNSYDEYIWTADGAWEKIGDTEIDLSGYVQKETGKGLFSGSYNDLSNKPTIPAAVTVDSALSGSSTNPVQNSVVTAALDGKQASILQGSFDIGGTGKLLSLFVPVNMSGATIPLLVNTSFGTEKLLALKADSSSLPYALVDVTPTAGAPFVLAACFPIKYENTDISEAHTVQLTDISHITVVLNERSGKYEVFDSGFSAVYPVFLLNADGTYSYNGSDVDSLTFGANDDPAVAGTTQVLGFTPTAQLTDRAINAVSLTASATLTMPAANAGHARDFVVRLSIGAANIGITWGTADADGVAVDYETEDGEFPDLSAAGTYLVRLTETAAFAAGTGGADDVPAKFLIQCQPLQTAVAGGGQ